MRNCALCCRSFSNRHGRAVMCGNCATSQYERQSSAHSRVRNAIKRGVLRPAKGQQCTDCERPAVMYDHRDYSKPFEVDPVCGRCNSRRGLSKGVRPALTSTIEKVALHLKAAKR